jgi:hypothetical protein
MIRILNIQQILKQICLGLPCSLFDKKSQKLSTIHVVNICLILRF